MTSLDLCFSLKIRSKDSYLALDKNRTKLYKKNTSNRSIGLQTISELFFNLQINENNFSWLTVLA